MYWMEILSTNFFSGVERLKNASFYTRGLFCLFDLILYIPVNNFFQSCQGGSSWVEPVLNRGYSVICSKTQPSASCEARTLTQSLDLKPSTLNTEPVTTSLTHISLTSFLRDTCKQCRPRFFKLFFSGKNIILCILKGISTFKMHKIIIFSENLKKSRFHGKFTREETAKTHF